jgi:hypothetical protein
LYVVACSDRRMDRAVRSRAELGNIPDGLLRALLAFDLTQPTPAGAGRTPRRGGY